MPTKRDYALETQNRIKFIREILSSAGADGVVFGNSGGKDCALVGMLCKKACENTVGVIMPCEVKRNFEEDKTDAEIVAEWSGTSTRFVDITDAKNAILQAIDEKALNNQALSNIAPRLRMTTLYTIAANENKLVAGTGNRSEIHMGYFTKWGDGAYDFNPIADLTVTEVYEFLRYLDAPDIIFNKPPSAGLFEGQTDEQEMGVTYASIDEFLLNGDSPDRDVIGRYHSISGHKRKMPAVYSQ